MVDDFGIGKAAVINVDSKAYMQIYLHAAKYPSSNIVGFLLGQQRPNGEVYIVVKYKLPVHLFFETTYWQLPLSSKVVVEDLMPVCHSYPTASVLEIAALTVSAY